MENIKQYLQKLITKWDKYEVYGGAEALSFQNDIEMLLEHWNERIEPLERIPEETKSQSGEREEIKEIKRELRKSRANGNTTIAFILYKISEARKKGISEGYQNCLDDMNENKAYKENKLV